MRGTRQRSAPACSTSANPSALARQWLPMRGLACEAEAEVEADPSTTAMAGRSPRRPCLCPHRHPPLEGTRTRTGERQLPRAWSSRPEEAGEERRRKRVREKRWSTSAHADQQGSRSVTYCAKTLQQTTVRI